MYPPPRPSTPPTVQSPVQSLWVGDALSPIEQLSAQSFLHHGHEFHLYAYDELAGVPAGVVVKDAADIIPRREVFMHRIGTYAIFSDWFRWALLYRRGGWWADMDVICLRPFLFDDAIVFGGDKNIAPGGARSGGGMCRIDVLKFPPRHAFCLHMLERCAAPNRFTPYDTWPDRARKLKRILLRRGKEYTGWGEAGGPRGFTRALEHFDLLKHAKSFEVFSPYLVYPRAAWQRILLERFDGDVDALFPASYSFHIGNEYLRRDGYDKHRPLPAQSLLGKLHVRYR